MNTSIDKLTKKFTELIKNILLSLDLNTIDDILDSRDSDVFSNLWMQAWQKVEDKNLTIDSQREEIFKLVFSKTESSDLAAYITEDFELISKYLYEEDNNWVSNLYGTYFDHKIPCGELKNKEIKLAEMINK